MLKSKNLWLSFLLFQIFLVFWIQTATNLQKMISLPSLIIFLAYFTSNLSQIKQEERKNSRFGLLHKSSITAVITLLLFNTLFASDRNLMKQVMFGWDFVGHFGIFRWGLNNLELYTSQNTQSSNYIESYLDSNYPQTWALWGANFFRLMPQENFLIMKALLVFSIFTLLVAYLIFTKTSIECWDELKTRTTDSVEVKFKKKTAQQNLYVISFYIVIISFIAFCWNTNCPHFALSTSLIFRVTLLSLVEKNSIHNDIEKTFCLLVAFILYPLTMIFSGLYIYTYLRRKFVNFSNSNLKINLIDFATNISILCTALGIVLIKPDKGISLETLIFSYGGVTFPSFVLVIVMIIIICLGVYSKISRTQIIQVVFLSLPLIILSLLLIVRNGELSYYGAKSTIAFATLLIGFYSCVSLDSKGGTFTPLKMFIALFCVLSALLLVKDKVSPIFDDVNKRGVPMLFLRVLNSYELPRNWEPAENVVAEIYKMDKDSNYKPIFTSGNPYLANMWLAMIGRYPKEIFEGTGNLISGQLPIVLDYSNPIAFISRNLETEQIDSFKKEFPYITVVPKD